MSRSERNDVRRNVSSVIKSPRPEIRVKIPTTTNISMSVNPFLRIKVLGNFINWGDDGNSDEPDDDAHENHEHRFNTGR